MYTHNFNLKMNFFLFQNFFLKVLKIQIQSLERAEEQAKQLLKERKVKISDTNRKRFEKHAKALETLQSRQNLHRLQRSQSLKAKLTNHDQWMAHKSEQHLETLKKAKKAAELRQIIG